MRDSTDGHEAENLIVALDRFIEAAVIGRPAISQVAHLAEKQSDRDQGIHNPYSVLLFNSFFVQKIDLMMQTGLLPVTKIWK